MNIYQYLIEPVVSIFLPALCIQCQAPLPPGRKVVCRNCYDTLPILLPEHLRALRLELEKCYFDQFYVIYQFSPLFQELIHLLKYQRFLSIARYFAESLASRITQKSYDLITAVPLNPIRLRERGYNQSALIAQASADILGLAFSDKLLIRKRNTQTQTKLSRKERIKNVRNAFAIKGNIKGQSILIIDDVLTTGSTLDECARILKQNGAKQIDVAAMATPVNHSQIDAEEKNPASVFL